MKLEFLPNNTHLDNVETFAQTDIHLRRMREQKYVFESPIIQQLPIDIPGIYNLGGGRQVGKSTLLKQWMEHLLTQQTPPTAIAFISCELIVDEQSLYRILIDQFAEMPNDTMRYLILDEITYVRNWDKAIKYLADTGAFEKTVVVISGSDLIMMQQARKRFPGRRGKADKVDFHYYPLSFRQTVQLKKVDTDSIDALFKQFDEYLVHGGFLTAINEYATQGSVSIQTLATYSDWIRGDVIKQGKQELYLRELARGIIKHYSSQISWRNLLASLSIDHVQTVIDYAELLKSMDAIYIQLALLEDKLTGAPKKNRKLMFADPFIFHAVNAWLHPTADPYTMQIQPSLDNPAHKSKLVEATVVTHFQRKFPTYYIKSQQEVDLAYIDQERFWPIEIKWTNQIHPHEIQQILKYPNGKIWSKSSQSSTIQNTAIVPLAQALYDLVWSAEVN